MQAINAGLQDEVDRGASKKCSDDIAAAAVRERIETQGISPDDIDDTLSRRGFMGGTASDEMMECASIFGILFGEI